VPPGIGVSKERNTAGFDDTPRSLSLRPTRRLLPGDSDCGEVKAAPLQNDTRRYDAGMGRFGEAQLNLEVPLDRCDVQARVPDILFRRFSLLCCGWCCAP
jgi:hypothetical protein